MSVPSRSHPLSAAASRENPRNVESLSTARGKSITRACLACKIQKSKYTEDQLCSVCIGRNRECLSNDPSGLRHDEHEDMGKERDIIQRLVSKLRDSEYTHAMQLLHLLRSNAPLHEIASQLDLQRDGEVDHVPALAEDSSESQPSRQQPTSARRILDVLDLRVISVPAKPWTTVTDDDDFVSHLISLWFTWYQPWLNFIERDLFIRDMQLGDLESEYCSPFLVNAILADACAYSNFQDAYADPTDVSSRGIHFYGEAKRHLEDEEGRIKLPTVQGLCALSVCACAMGKDRRGWIYLGQLAYAAREYFRSNPPDANPADEAATTFDKAVSHAAWGLYNTTTYTAMSYQRVPPLEKPTRSLPPIDHSNTSDKWYPYPSLSGGVDGHSQCIFNSHCELARINSDICWLLFDERQSVIADSDRVVTDIFPRLQKWCNNLPACLTTAQDAPLPQLLSLHMYYNTIIITLFAFLKKAHEHNKRKSSLYVNPDNLIFASAREVSRLVQIQRSTWGVHIFSSSCMQWVTVSLFALLDDINDPQSRTAFVSLCVAARAAARRWHIGKAMLRAIQVTAKRMEAPLPPETEALFADFETECWGMKDLDELSSLYPNFTVSTKADASDDIELDRFLGQWDALLTKTEGA